MAKGFDISGIKEIKEIFEEIAPKYARNLARTTNHAVAAEITKGAKQNIRNKTGILKKSLKTKRKKSPPDKPVSHVFVEHGKSAKNDGFYWRFIEYGTRGKTGQKARPFIGPAAEKIRADLTNIYREQFGKKLEALLKREAKKQAKK